MTEKRVNSKERLRSWAALLFCLVVLLPPLLVRLGVNSSISSMESIALLTSQETWIRQCHGENKAWLVPSLKSETRLEKPPLNVWLDMLAWWNLDPDTTSPEIIVGRGRFISVLLGLAVLVGTFWIGHQLGGLQLATAATLMTGTFFLFLKQARIASYDIQMAGWVTLAIAAALWSLGSLRASPALWRKRFPGLLLAGAFLGAAIMTKGPLAIVLFVVPVLIGILLSPGPRAAGVAGLFLALITGLVLAAPWFIYVLRNVPGALQTMLFEYEADYHKETQPWYYLQLVPLVFPWSLWMIGSLSVPFGIRDKQTQRRALFPWLWFVLMIIGFTIPNAKAPRYLAPLLPAIGLMTARFWLKYWTAECGPIRWLKYLGRTHWVLLLILSACFPLYLLLEGKLMHAGLINKLLFPGATPVVGILIGVLLIALSAAGAWAHARGKSTAAILLTAGWMVSATTFGFDIYLQAPHLLVKPGLDNPPSREFLFYSRRVVPPVSSGELEQKLRHGESFYVITRADPVNEELMAKLGFIPVFEFQDGSVPTRRLYRSSVTKPEHTSS